MKFFTLILKNPFRNKTRTILAIIGIAIGIATIITLGIITDGLKLSTEETLTAGGADFSIAESDAPDLFGSEIDEDYVEKINEVEGVRDTVGILMASSRVEDQPFFVIVGIDPEKFAISNIKVTEGRAFASGESNELILGKVASERLEKNVGDDLTLNREEYEITGVFETGDLQQDGGAFLSLENVQEIENKENIITMIYAQIETDAQIEEVTAAIENQYGEDLTTISSLEDIASISQGLQTIDTASWSISLLAIVIGGIGVVNTMIMSVYERTREIGVLKAVGWKEKRILGMILGESIVLTLVAGLVGALMGIIAIQILLILGMRDFITPVYTLNVFLRGFSVALAVGLLGGFYPAYRASRLPPTEALRYE